MTFTGPNQGATAAGEEAARTKTVTRDQPKVGTQRAVPLRVGQEVQEVLRRRDVKSAAAPPLVL